MRERGWFGVEEGAEGREERKAVSSEVEVRVTGSSERRVEGVSWWAMRLAGE